MTETNVLHFSGVVEWFEGCMLTCVCGALARLHGSSSTSMIHTMQPAEEAVLESVHTLQIKVGPPPQTATH